MDSFRNQYFISKEKLHQLSNWNSFQISDWNIYVHPKLNSKHYKSENSELLILGLILDISSTNHNVDSIAQNLLSKDKKEWIDYFTKLSGTFILLINRNNDTKVYSDSGTFKKVFYLKSKNPCLAPDPLIINSLRKLEITTDQDELEYYNSKFFSRKQKWIGDKTIFKNLYQLQPNHYLDLNDLSTHRFWPYKKKTTLEPEVIGNKLVPYFKNQVNQLSKSYNINLSLTAGWDSRMTMLSCLDIIPLIKAYTFFKPNFPTSKTDINIARQICNTFDIPHKAIKIPDANKTTSDNNVNDNFYLSRTSIANVLENGFKKHFSEDDITINGLMSEVAKSYFGIDDNWTGEKFAYKMGLSNLKFPIQYFDQWIEQNNELFNDYSYDISDMFHWEMNIIHEAGVSRNMLDSYGNSHSPFNSIYIINLLLSSRRSLRDDQIHSLYKSILSRYLPEIQTIPINPYFKFKVIVLMKKLGIYNKYKKILFFTNKNF